MTNRLILGIGLAAALAAGCAAKREQLKEPDQPDASGYLQRTELVEKLEASYYNNFREMIKEDNAKRLRFSRGLHISPYLEEYKSSHHECPMDRMEDIRQRERIWR